MQLHFPRCCTQKRSHLDSSTTRQGHQQILLTLSSTYTRSVSPSPSFHSHHLLQATSISGLVGLSLQFPGLAPPLCSSVLRTSLGAPRQIMPRFCSNPQSFPTPSNPSFPLPGSPLLYFPPLSAAFPTGSSLLYHLTGRLLSRTSARMLSAIRAGILICYGSPPSSQCLAYSTTVR